MVFTKLFMNPVAMAAVGDKKNLINWLVGLSVLIALFESATLFLIFSFVSTLMGKSYEVGALGLLPGLFLDSHLLGFDLFPLPVQR